MIEIKFVPIGQLKPRPNNRNSHPKEQIDRLIKIIEYQGFRRPIIVSNLSGHVVCGHGRLEAAKKMGIKEVPVIFQDYVDADQEYADHIADNSLQAWSELDLSGINTDIADLGPDFDISWLGIKDFTLDIAEKLEPGCDEDEVPEAGDTRCKLGDRWLLGDHVLVCGDSTDVCAIDLLMMGEKADMVFTDPPYGVNYQKKDKVINGENSNPHGGIRRVIHGDDFSLEDLKEMIQGVFANIYTILADKSSYYICSPQGGDLGLMMMMMMQEAGIKCRHMIIWVKNAPVFSMGRLDYDYRHEPILYGWSKSHEFEGGGEMKNSVWEISREPNKLHPTMKPVAIPENAIKNSSKAGGIVVDLFGGSGTTLLASEKTNRRARLMEIDPHYCDVILARWEKYTGKTAILQASGPELTEAEKELVE